MSEVFVTLISVTFGAMLGFLFNYMSEISRWRRELKKELERDMRKAISQTLSWLDPIKNAMTVVESISIAFVRGSIEQEELMQKWPSLLSELSNMDVRPDLRLLLPQNIYPQCIEITMRIHQLQHFSIETGQALRHPNEDVKKRGRAGFDKMSEELNEVRSMLKKFENMLSDAYKRTYET